MSLKSAYILPHPPIVIDKIGGKDTQKCLSTKKAMEDIAKEVKEISPDTIVIISPHGPVFSDAVTVNYTDKLEGDLRNFALNEFKLSKKNDFSLVEEIYAESHLAGVSIAKLDSSLYDQFNIEKKLDHGALVPLYFIEQLYKDYQLVHLTYGGLSAKQHYKFGQGIRKACENLDKKIIFIASGDLSHKLSNQGPYSYAKEGPIFDNQLINLLLTKDPISLINMDKKLIKKAGECGKRSIDTLMGVLDGYNYEIELLNYEKPFGVGYSVFSINNFVIDKSRNFYDAIHKKSHEIFEAKKSNEDIYVKLARLSIEKYVNDESVLSLESIGKELPKEMLDYRAGVFVSIKDSNGLRGCMGTTGHGIMASVAEEIIRNAIQASTKDPRFPKIEPWELEDLTISVDVLKPAEKVTDISELDPDKFGIIVSKGHKRGLLLPNLEGINTVDKQLDIALKKAGIVDKQDYSVEKFLVERHE